MSERATNDILDVTAWIVTAHLTNNPVEAAALPALIQSVYRTLSTVAEPESGPAVPVQNSVFPNFIVCLEDGKKLKMLKPHLKISYGMTADDYRTKWGLPPDYPMVAPNYTLKRSTLAKQANLNRRIVDMVTLAPATATTQLSARRACVSRG